MDIVHDWTHESEILWLHIPSKLYCEAVTRSIFGNVAIICNVCIRAAGPGGTCPRREASQSRDAPPLRRQPCEHGVGDVLEGIVAASCSAANIRGDVIRERCVTDASSLALRSTTTSTEEENPLLYSSRCAGFWITINCRKSNVINRRYSYNNKKLQRFTGYSFQ